MFRQMDEAFSHMMKNFGAFGGMTPDEGMCQSCLKLQSDEL